eukprot:scaffold5965_cov69-Phaeocystis_antarctica.AAC.1
MPQSNAQLRSEKPCPSRPHSEPPRRWVLTGSHAHFSLRALLALVVSHRAAGSLDAHQPLRALLALVVQHPAADEMPCDADLIPLAHAGW